MEYQTQDGSNMKFQKEQTAIDWLIDQYKKDDGKFMPGVYEQAKEMEKEQIIAAVRYGQNNHTENVYEEGELYYNEIYNSDAPFIKSSIPKGNIEITKTNSNMKLYTENQLQEAYNRGLMDGRLNNVDYSIPDGFKPIELPSDEYIDEVFQPMTELNAFYKDGFINGAKWMKEQIIGLETNNIEEPK
jgi:cell division protein YceG involved in septum cleavage